ncbi:DDB1- and CUL4-associated factor 13 (DCA13) [Vairimorpha necatrix]|uniref:DDB1- and CUL4-associated factor 13 (DCA13) n=1 Tax=Vairimorpha necatrix TaxID=6039 RepID=A0AAX4JCP1_9MICR
MKINTIYHQEQEYKKERKRDLSITKHSKNPLHHPFMKERELIRAINSTKLDRLFAKPFITALSYHREGITQITKSSVNPYIVSTSFDNEIILSDIENRTKISKCNMNSKIKGIGIDNMNNVYIGDNKTIRICNKKLDIKKSEKILNNSAINNLEVDDALYVAGYNSVAIYDLEMRSKKIEYSVNNVDVITHNKSFTHLVGFANEMKNFIVDMRLEKIVMDFTLPNKTNAMCFSPSDGYFLASANEDTNGYIHDLRYIESPCNTLRGHVSAVTCIKYNPNGQELCTGSFDQTIRIFKNSERKSREVYYNQRMHNIVGLEYSNDGKFIISGSDDGSLRLWKNEASLKSGPLSRKEKDVQTLSKVLIDKYKNVEEVERINKHRFIPKLLKEKMKQKHEHYEAEVRKGHIKKNNKF